MRRCLFVTFLGVPLSLAGCRCDSPPPVTPPTAAKLGCRDLTPDAVARNNCGVALLDQFRYDEARAEFESLLRDYPDCPELVVNLAVADLNQTQKGDTALPLLAKVLADDPAHARAAYLSGLLHLHAGRHAEALPLFERLAKAHPHDHFISFQLANCHEPTDRNEALKWHRKAVELEPLFRTPYYRLFDLTRQSGEMPAALEFLNDFKRLDQHPRAEVFEFKYTHMGPLAAAIRIDGAADKPTVRPSGNLFAEPTPLCGDVAAANATSITVAELNATGELLVLVTAANERNVVLLRQADQTFKQLADHPLAAFSDMRSAAWGDFDNDGLADVALASRAGTRLVRQRSTAEWEDVTDSARLSDRPSRNVLFCDFDHDGDLDLLLANDDVALLVNLGNGTFRDEPLSKEPGKLDDVVGDTNADGQLELYSLLNGIVHRTLLPPRSRTFSVFDRHVAWASSPCPLKQVAKEKAWAGSPCHGFGLADFDGDGKLEAILGGEQWSVCRMENDSLEQLVSSSPDLPLSAWTVAVLSADRGPAVIGAPKGQPLQVWLPGPGRFPFLSVSPTGKPKGGSQERTNASGIGVQVECRVGNRTTVVINGPRNGGPGQSLQPISFGLAGAKQADYVRFVWTDGVIQSERNLAVGPRHRIAEENRIPSSCPLLFAWNGERYEFVSDVLGVGGLGYFLSPGVYAPANPRENFLLPHGLLRPSDGELRLKLSEPMEELTYLDRIALVHYDLPPGWRMTLDERAQVSGPEPTGEPRFYRRLLSPTRAINDRGEDVTAALAAVDHEPADPGPLDRRFTGLLAREHDLELTFRGTGFQPVKAQRPLLIADGWIEYPFSQTGFAAWQAGCRFAAPTVEARGADGEWQTICQEFGYPAGMPRQMSLPLDNLPADTTQLRLRTNQEIYWDRLAIAFAEPCPHARRELLPLRRADLREGGFTFRELRSHRRPWFNDAARVPLADTRDPAGFYSAFGSVRELVCERDDALAIFGPGEELSLSFSAPASAPPDGWRREFVLELHGWCKDMDRYTEHGETVEPLPRSLPDSKTRDELHRRFNTRYQ